MPDLPDLPRLTKAQGVFAAQRVHALPHCVTRRSEHQLQACSLLVLLWQILAPLLPQQPHRARTAPCSSTCRYRCWL